MSTIYLVTRGEYSDFGVVAAVSTQEAAEQAVSDGLGDAWEECPLDAPRDKIPDGMKCYSVSVNLANGHCWPCVRESYEGDGIETPFTLHKARVYCGSGSMTVLCWAKDDARASKIASEKRREHLAGLSPSALEKLASYTPPERPEGMTFAVTKDMIINDGAVTTTGKITPSAASGSCTGTSSQTPPRSSESP